MSNAVQLALFDVGLSRSERADRLAQIEAKIEAEADAGLLDVDAFDSRDPSDCDA